MTLFPQLLSGRAAIVTGGGSGIGRGSALALSAAGAAIAVNDIDGNSAEETVELIHEMGGTALAVEGDVTRETSVAEMFDVAERAFGPVDVLHANAGFERYASLESAELSDMERIVAVDFLAVLLCAREGVRRMKAAGGSIILTSSVQASHSLPGATTYSGAKAGVVAAARTLAAEVGLHGIRVNVISPGTIETPMLESALVHMQVGNGADPRGAVAAANALRRIGRVEEVGNVVVFLASEASSYITGANIVVDGGFTAIKTFG